MLDQMRDSAAAMPMMIAKKALAGSLQAPPVNGTMPLLYGDKGLVEFPMFVRLEVDEPEPALPDDETDELPNKLPEPLVLPDVDEPPDTKPPVFLEVDEPPDTEPPVLPEVDEPPEVAELPGLPTPDDVEGMYELVAPEGLPAVPEFVGAARRR